MATIDYEQADVQPASSTDETVTETVTPTATEPAPAPAESGSLSDYLKDFSIEGLQTPSAYDSDFIKEGLSQIRQSYDTGQTRAMSEMEERMSLRGMTGSSVEAQTTADLLGQLNRARAAQEYGLIQDAARSYGADRATAAQIALSTLGAEQQQEFFESQLEEEARQFDVSLDEAQSARLQEYGIAQDELDLKAKEIKQGWKALSIQEARDKAEIEIRLEQLAQDAWARGEEFDIARERQQLEDQQFNQQLQVETQKVLNDYELRGRSITLEEARLEAEKQWEEDRVGEVRAQRLQDKALSVRDLEIRAEQIANDYDIDDRELARDYAEMDMRREQYLTDLGLEQDKLQVEAERIRQEYADRGEERTFRQAMQEAEQNAMREQWMAEIGIDEAQIELAYADISAQNQRQIDQINAARDQTIMEIEGRAALRATELQAEAEGRGETLDAEAAMQAAMLEHQEEINTANNEANAALQTAQIDHETLMQTAELKVVEEKYLAEIGIEQAKIDARAQEIIDAAELRGDEMTHEAAMHTAQIEALNTRHLLDIGIDQATIDARADEIIAAAALRGDEMAHEAAMQTAEIEARAAILQQQIEADTLARGDEYVAELALEEARQQAQIDMEKNRQDSEILLQNARYEAEETLQTSRLTAQQELEDARALAERDMLDAEHEAQKAMFADQLGFDREELEQAKLIFDDEIKDREAQRLHEAGLQTDSQEWMTQEAQYDRLLEKSMQELAHKHQEALQAGQLSWEDLWRQADDQLQRDLADLDDEFRRDALADENTWREAQDALERDMRAADRQQQAQLEEARVAMQGFLGMLGFTGDIFGTMGEMATYGDTPPPTAGDIFSTLFGSGFEGMGGDTSGAGMIATLLGLLGMMRTTTGEPGTGSGGAGTEPTDLGGDGDKTGTTGEVD